MASSSPSAENTSPKAPPSKTQLVLSILLVIFGISFTVLLCFLAADTFTLPYLTPLAHFLKAVITPLVPFVFPVYLGMFIKVVRYRAGQLSPIPPHKVRGEWKGKRTWVFITAAWAFQHFARVMGDVSRLLFGGADGVVGKGKGWELDVCELRSCKGPWIEACAVLLVVLCEIRGVKWDGGLLERWIENIAAQADSQATTEGESVRRMEEGECAAGGEKDALIGGE